MNTTLLASIALLLALILAALFYRLPKARRDYIRATLTWVCGLLAVFAVGILWLGFLGLAIFLIYRAHGRDEVASYVALFAFILVILGIAFVRFVNGFYDWWRDQRVSSILKEIDDKLETQARIDKLESDFLSEFSETFKRQLQSSPTFHATVIEAKRLAEEVAAFSAVPHTNEELDASRKAWQAKSEKFAERIAQGDPLAVGVILKAIQKESEKAQESSTMPEENKLSTTASGSSTRGTLPAPTAQLTAWSKFRFCAGTFFCFVGGLANTPLGFSDMSGLIAGVVIFAVISFGIAYAVKRKNWNAVSQWFFWIALILPGLIAAQARR